MATNELGTYMIAQKGGPYVKIGAALNVAKRIRDLQMASPLELYVAMWIPNFDMERQLHKQFKIYKIRGEWFRAIDRI
jgi:hypothetical protein